jgi:hypothetical protein
MQSMLTPCAQDAGAGEQVVPGARDGKPVLVEDGLVVVEDGHVVGDGQGVERAVARAEGQVAFGELRKVDRIGKLVEVVVAAAVRGVGRQPGVVDLHDVAFVVGAHHRRVAALVAVPHAVGEADVDVGVLFGEVLDAVGRVVVARVVSPPGVADVGLFGDARVDLARAVALGGAHEQNSEADDHRGQDDGGQAHGVRNGFIRVQRHTPSL